MAIPKHYSITDGQLSALIMRIRDIASDWGAERISTEQYEAKLKTAMSRMDKYEVPHFDLSKPSGRMEAQEFFEAH